VNKVASKVELRFDLAGTDALRDDVKERLRALAGRHVDAEGKVVLRSDRTRDQLRNLEDARERLRQLVLRALVVPKRRRPTKPSRAARTRRLEDKRHAAAKKRARGSAGLDA
jgi:ribosome-associated protein